MEQGVVVGPQESAVGAFALKIGEMEELSGLTRRALRLYEERGLIVLRRTKANMRLYDQAARDRIRWIAGLRRAGLGLQEIGRVLGSARAEPDRAAVLRLLADRRGELQREQELVELVIAEFAYPSAADLLGSDRKLGGCK